MEGLLLTPTFKTPEIRFDPASGHLKIAGRVFPENPKDFFLPVLDWLKQYAESPASGTQLTLNLSYFNSSSNEFIFRCCKMVEQIGLSGNKASIVWEFEDEDEDMRQMGEDYRELLKINFEIHSVH